MGKLEIELESAHLDALECTEQYDRGYLIGDLNHGERLVFVSRRIVSASQGTSLIDVGDIKKATLQSLLENQGYIPFINHPNEKIVMADALTLFIADRMSLTNKFVSYCIVNDDIHFYRIEKDGGVASIVNVPYAARRSA